MGGPSALFCPFRNEILKFRHFSRTVPLAIKSFWPMLRVDTNNRDWFFCPINEITLRWIKMKSMLHFNLITIQRFIYYLYVILCYILFYNFIFYILFQKFHICGVLGFWGLFRANIFVLMKYKKLLIYFVYIKSNSYQINKIL